MKIKSIFILLITILCFFVFLEFKNKHNNFRLYDNFTLYPDEENIIFTGKSGDFFALYKSDLNGNNLKIITKPKKTMIDSLDYSKNGEKILFISYKKDNIFDIISNLIISDIYVLDVNNNIVNKLTQSKEHITKAVWGDKEDIIYFIKSSYFGSSSPIAQSHPHGFDIYSITLIDKNIKRLTYLNGYSMADLFYYSNENKLLISRRNSSIYELTLDKLGKFTEITPKGEFGENLFTDPQISEDGRYFLFVSVSPNTFEHFKYELYITDLINKNTKRLTNLGKRVENPRFLNKKKKIIFLVEETCPGKSFNIGIWKEEEKNYKLMQINYDGTGLEEIKLDLPTNK